MFGNLKENRWRTVAVDTRASWHFVKDPDREFEHVLVYQINDKTGERRMTYDDASDHGREYAEKGNDAVAKMRSKWVHAGLIIPPKSGDENKVTYIDPAYAPYGSMQKYIEMMKRDPAVQDMLDEKMIDDAFGQLEVAIKLTQNNGAP
jgi:hypothetical protein